MAIDKTLVLDSSEHIDKPEVTNMKDDKEEEVEMSSAGQEAREIGDDGIGEDKTHGLPIDRGWAWVVLAGILVAQ